MKLLALYVENYRHLFKNIMFNFSATETVSYQDGCLYITKNAQYNNFYGSVLKNITAVVGKNGIGKTSLLNLLGYSQKERIETMLLNSGEIRDKYFLLYAADDEKRYFIEKFGDFRFNNIAGLQRPISEDRRNTTIMGDFYFTGSDNTFCFESYPADLRNDILYLSGGKEEKNLGITQLIPSDRDYFMSRHQELNSLQLWYRTFVDLYKKKIIESKEAKILIEKSKLLSSETKFWMQSLENREDYRIDKWILWYGESFDDMLSHHLSLFANQILGKAEDNDKIYRFYDKYKQKRIEWNPKRLREFFDDLITVLNRKTKFGVTHSEADSLISILRKYNDLYEKLYFIRDKIIPGIYGFALRFQGRHIEDDVMEFCEAYDVLQEYLASTEFEQKDLELINIYPEVIPLMSSGERKIIALVSYIVNEVWNNLKNMTLGDTGAKKNYIIIVDDIEKELHLEWSRNIINCLIEYFNKRTFDIGVDHYTLDKLHVTIQLIFSTHSPFMLSDLHSSSVLKMKEIDGKIVCEKGEKVFAQNIYRILNQEFFIRRNYGAYAEKRINEVIKWLRGEKTATQKQIREYEEIINEIGEPILQKKLSDMYKRKMENNQMKSENGFGDYLKQKYGDRISEEEAIKVLDAYLQK